MQNPKYRRIKGKVYKMFKWAEKIKNNHGLMMLVCCVAPLALMSAAVYFFGLGKSYLYWLVVLLCPITHFLMMKDMHKEHAGKKEKGGCH